MKTKLNVAQIGVGYWGPNLVRNLVNNDRCDLLKVCEISKDRRNFIKNLYPKIHTTFNINEILNDNDIDAVIIATPVSTHYDLAMKVLNSNKHVLIEKPMAQTAQEVEKIEIKSSEKKLIAMVGHTFLYNPAVKYIKKLINENTLGKIRYIYSQRLNLGRIRSDVNALWNLAPHDISIIQYWLDNPEIQTIKYSGESYVQKGIDDVAFLNIKYKNKILANIHVSWLDPHKIRKMTIVGSKKMVVYDDISNNKVSIFDKGIDKMAVLGENMDFDNVNTFSYDYRSGNIKIPDIKWIEPLKAEIDHFFDCILDGQKCLTDAKHAKKVIQILSLNES
jgi:predicted dehydrogenase